MSFINKIKAAATAIHNAVADCTCGPENLGIPGGCQCDFLDETSPTTSDFVQPTTN